MEAKLNLDATRFNSALALFARYSKKDGLTILLDQAKGFVRRAIAITPPSTGNATSSAKKRGEEAVRRDLRFIFDPLDTHEWKAFLDDAGGLRVVPTHRANRRGAEVTDYSLFLKRDGMEFFHKSMRNPNTGRVRRVDRQNLIGRKKSDISAIGFVTKRDFAWFERIQVKKVGKLADGFSPAAVKLGYNPPTWIRRHGGHGQVSIVMGKNRFAVSIINGLPFASHVKGLERRLQQALNEQATAMQRKVDFYLEKRAKEAGFK